MLKEVRHDQTWIHEIDDESSFTCRPFGGALTKKALDEAYFEKCILEATGFTYCGKAIKSWSRKTGIAKYMNGKEAYIGMVPFHKILEPVIATDLLSDIMEHSLLGEGEEKN